MLSFENLKTFWNAVKSYLNDRFKTSRANWTQNDTAADDYIRNRPFYKDSDDVVHKLPDEFLSDSALTKDEAASTYATAEAFSPIADTVRTHTEQIFTKDNMWKFFIGIIGADAFSYSNIKSINSETIVEVQDRGFSNCESLTDINLPNCKKIGNNVFSECNQLSNINLPNVTEIDTYGAFMECIALTNIDLSSLTEIYRYTFKGCKSLVHINIPQVTHIYDNAFESCSSLTNINLPQVIYIGSFAFSGCTSLQEKLVLPSVQELDAYSLTWNNLKVVDLPAVTKMDSPFSATNSLETLILRNNALCTLTSRYLDNNTAGLHVKEGFYIYVPNALLSTYKRNALWQEYADKFRAIEDYPEICGETTTA